MPFVYRFVLKLAAALGLASALAACGPRIPDTISIGVAQPLSGPSAARGQDLLNGALLAADELNASNYKINGKTVKIEIVAKDDKASKEIGAQVAQELVDAKVSAVIGHLSSDVTEVAMPIYKAGNVPQFFTSSSTQLITPGEKGNVFRMVANDGLQAKAVAGFVTSTLKAKNVAIIYENTNFGQPMSKDVAAALGTQGKAVALNEAVDNKRTDFKEFVAKLKASSADVLVAMLRDNQLLPLFAELAAAGLADLPVIATSVAKTQKLQQAPGAPSALYVTSGSIDSSEFKDNDFLNKFRAKYKADPVWAAHYAYDVVYVLTDVMKRARSVDPEVVREKLVTTSAMAPATGAMRFETSGEQVYGAISVYQRHAGKWDPLMRSDRW